MVDTLNVICALVSIALGCFGWLAPRYTLSALDLQPGGSTMGTSEIRASAGALFTGLGVGGLILGGSDVYAMMGFAWGGAAIGRLTSIILDGPTTRQKNTFFAVEAVVAGYLLWANL